MASFSHFLFASSTTEDETAALAEAVAPLFKGGDSIILSGQLGAGKTVFARAFINILLGHTVVTSPTFTLIQDYKNASVHVAHMDLYRLGDINEFALIGGFDKSSEGAISLIEWGEKLIGELPERQTFLLEVGLVDGVRNLKLFIPDERAAEFGKPRGWKEGK